MLIVKKYSWTCVLATLLVQSVLAAPSSRDLAKERFKAGQVALGEAKFADAIREFEAANELAPHPAMLLNIARVYEAVGDLKSAVKFFKAYQAANPNAKGIGQKVAELRAQYASWPSVSIESSPSGLPVFIQSKLNPAIGKTPLRLRFKPGKHEITVVHNGQDMAKEVTFAQGQTSTVKFESSPSKGAVSNLTGESTTTTHQNSQAQVQVHIDINGAQIRIDDRLMGVSPLTTPLLIKPGIHSLEVVGPGGEVHKETLNLNKREQREVLVTLGSKSSWSSHEMIGVSTLTAGGIALVAGVASGFLALDANAKLKDCRSGDCAGTAEELKLANEVRSKAQMTDVLLGCGLALSTAGTYLWLSDDRSTQEATSHLEPPPTLEQYRAYLTGENQ